MLLFSRHARLRMLERNIKEDLVIKTIENPDNLIIENNQYIAAKQFDKSVLLVIYSKTDNIEFVVTVIFSSKMAKYLNR